MNTAILDKISKEQTRNEVPGFQIGDTVKVHVRIKEGDKERIQAFSGTVIAQNGSGATASITVRRISFNVGVERVFPLQSPNVTKIEIERPGKTRRAKMYYLRGLSGKNARIKERRVSNG